MSGVGVAAGVGAAAAVAGTVVAATKGGSPGQTSGNTSSNNFSSTVTNNAQNETKVVGPSNATLNTIGNSTITTLSPEALTMLQGLITGGSYSKSSAISDSKDAVTQGIQQVMQQYMPTIAANEKGSGMMGDSMTQILANQTAVQAGVQGANVRMNAINNYAGITTNLFNALISGSPKVTNSSTGQTSTDSGNTTTDNITSKGTSNTTGNSTGITSGTITPSGIDKSNAYANLANSGANVAKALGSGSGGGATPIDTTLGNNISNVITPDFQSSVPSYVPDVPAASSSGGGSVICTRYWSLGYLDKATWLADTEYGRNIELNTPTFKLWYLSWAQDFTTNFLHHNTLVNELFTKLFWHLGAKYWMRDMAWRTNGTGKGSVWGRCINLIGYGMYKFSKYGKCSNKGV